MNTNHHTCTNDNPEDFQLQITSMVLKWCSNHWAPCRFAKLNLGDIWMKQPEGPHTDS